VVVERLKAQGPRLKSFLLDKRKVFWHGFGFVYPDWLKPIVRILLMPFVCVSYILVRTSLATMILVGLLLIISAISFYTVIYRRRKYQI
jgi:hypothetical protein